MAEGVSRPMRGKSGGGPRTARGKAVVRLNPLKHGVLSQTPVIPLVEKEEDWERLRSGIFEYLDAQGALEAALADRIAGILWRLYRVVRFESESVSGYLHDVPKDWRVNQLLLRRKVPDEVSQEMVEEMDRMLMARLLPSEGTLEKVMRYESRLHRYLLQTLHQVLLLKGLKSYGSGRNYGMSDMEPPGLAGRAGRQPLPERGKRELLSG